MCYTMVFTCFFCITHFSVQKRSRMVCVCIHHPVFGFTFKNVFVKLLPIVSWSKSERISLKTARTTHKNNKYIEPFGAGYVCHFSHKLPNNIWKHFTFFFILLLHFMVFRRVSFEWESPLHVKHMIRVRVREEAQHLSHWMKIQNSVKEEKWSECCYNENWYGHCRTKTHNGKQCHNIRQHTWFTCYKRRKLNKFREYCAK